MSATTLPDEILQDIFRRLTGHSVVQCRSVCSRWRHAVDSLSDAHWEQICKHDWLRDEYTAACKKYGLLWRDSYKALNSWSCFSSAEMTKQLLCDGVKNFKVLPNGIVACLKYNGNSTTISPDAGFCDTIMYYNVQTLQECRREEFGFLFSSYSYDENEYFQVFVLHDCRLCIVIKQNKKEYFFNSLDRESIYFMYFPEFTLIDKEIYFRNSTENIIYVSRLRTEGDASIETVPLEVDMQEDIHFETIKGFSIKDGVVHILSDIGGKGNIVVHMTSRGNIYINKNGRFKWLCDIDYFKPTVFQELWDYGFNWKSYPLCEWICYRAKPLNIFYSHGMVLLTSKSDIKTDMIFSIHYVPFGVGGIVEMQKILKGQPKRSVTFKEILPHSELNDAKVCQLDIIETADSHKILALVAYKLFIFEFRIGS